MINAALQFIASRLNSYLRIAQSYQDDVVVVSKLMENDGKESDLAINKICLFLVNVENDVNVQQNVRREFDGVREKISSKQIFLNLYVVLASNFKNLNYAESLRYLSKSISFLQDHSVFNRSNSPDLPDGIEKMIMNMQNMNIQELNNMWGMLGCKYVPSVVYKIRTIALGGGYSYYRPYVIQFPTDIMKLL